VGTAYLFDSTLTLESMICNRQPSNDDTLGFAAAHTSSESNLVLCYMLVKLLTGSRETPALCAGSSSEHDTDVTTVIVPRVSQHDLPITYLYRAKGCAPSPDSLAPFGTKVSPVVLEEATG